MGRHLTRALLIPLNKTLNLAAVMLDKEVRREQVQAVRDADGVAALFAELGYRTDSRIAQTSEVLGITAESAATHIKKIERVADHDGQLQVYLFEVRSLTQALTQAVVRAFRNRTGQYLLVLTDDYDRLDLVLIERQLPAGKIEGLVLKQVTVRPRVVSIDRQNPTRAHLRLLRRLTYTESDPLYQFEKLRSAFDMAEWSEEFFNNRVLFSDYYLTERLPDTDAWKEDPKPAYRQLSALFAQASARWAGKSKAELITGLITPALEILGFTPAPGQGSTGTAAPDLSLAQPSAQGVSVSFCVGYPWGRWLDGKDDQRDAEASEENPGARIVSLLEESSVRWAILTNGKLWRLYSERAHSRSTNYYEIDLEETLAYPEPQGLDAAEAFRYFWLLFRARAFESEPSFLDDLFSGSEDYAKKLGERLKDRIFEQIFPLFAQGFIEHIRRRDGRRADLSQPVLDQIFQGTLAFLYRLLFTLYAEARDLLPVREYHGYGQRSLKAIKEEVAAKAGDLEDNRDDNLTKGYSTGDEELYRRITALCAVIDKGDRALNVPTYNGGLFMTDPPDDEETPEANNARFLRDHAIPDRWLARGLDRLARDKDEKSFKLVFIDYKSLGVRHLGSIHEGLLEFKLRVTPEKMAVVQGKRTEEIIPYEEAKRRNWKILRSGGGRKAVERVMERGAVYLENDRRERKATRSYYTPDHIVQYIVEHTVGPILEEKFAALAPKLRDAQRTLKQERDKAKALGKMLGKHDDPEHEAYLKHRQVVEELFDLKILDPAMGSGHFLVETVDFITDRMLHFLNGFPWNPVLTHLKETRETILAEMERQGITLNPARLSDVNLLKRHVLKRCIHGVDLNPMAAELAKVSLWLDCFTLGAPLSFLDHHLRCGNSLIGVTVEEVLKDLEPVTRIKTKARVAVSATEWKTVESTQLQVTLFGSRFAGLLLATDLMRHIGELSDVTAAQVQQSRAEYRKASDALQPFKRILDLYTSQWFGDRNPRAAGQRKAKIPESPVLAFLRSSEVERVINARGIRAMEKILKELSESDAKAAQNALETAGKKRFFHWELEFPEVFFGPRQGMRQVIERKPDAGFDAVIGNPPYDVLANEELGYYAVSQDLTFYESAPLYEPAIRGKKNLYKLFICRGVSLVNGNGAFSFIVPMPLLGDDQAAGVRKLLLEKTGLSAVEAFPQKDDPSQRVFPEAKLSTTIFVTRSSPGGQRFALRTHPGHSVVTSSPKFELSPSEVLAFDPENAAIPSCTQKDWDIVVQVVNCPSIRRMTEVAVSYQGEVNETVEREKGTLTAKADAPVVLRGSNICPYAVREASQGEEVRLNVSKFLKGKAKDAKAFAYKCNRVGFQRSSPQNNFRRIIAAPIGPGNFCFDTVSYVTEESTELDVGLLLALLNSKFMDWYFRLGSTNSKVNEYQFNSLPVPTIHGRGDSQQWRALLKARRWAELAGLLRGMCNEAGVMPEPVAEALAEMSRQIQAIEAKRVLQSRSERSHLAPEAQPIQDAIDTVLFRCYGLSDEDARYIEQRLREML